MPYPLREEKPGSYYHVVTRGNNKRDIYTDDDTRLMFLLRLRMLAKEHRWRVLAYCQMNNHYHLVLQLSAHGLARGMQSLNGGYAMAFNARHGRRDHLFGRRYWSRELDPAEDLLTTCAYIDLNPTRSFGIEPADWQWSSYRAAIGLDAPVGFHRVHDLWKLLKVPPRSAMEIYRSLVWP